MQRENREFNASGDIETHFRYTTNFSPLPLLRKIGRLPPHYP